VFGKLWRSVKNFFALFIACALLAIVFFSLIEFFAEKDLRDQQLLQEYNLRLIRVLYFTGVFVDGLTKSFLPQYFHGLAIEAQFGLKSVSTLFTIFFAAYSMALVPAGWTVERKGAKPVLVCGVVLILAGQLTMTLIPDIYAMFIAQGLSGFGHGIFFIGIQSYILSIVSGVQRVRGIAIIVFGYNGGILAGAPVGALLAAYMSPRNVFLAGASLSLLLLIYIIKLIQKASVAKFEHRATASRLSPPPGMLQGLGKVIKDFKFMKTVVFIAIPTKIIMAGFISVSLPLILAQHNYKTDDIGQIIIFYFAGVLFTSRYISKQADRLGKTYNILFLGALCSGVGLILFGLMDVEAIQLPGLADTGILFALAGMIAIGCGHGFIQAPVISYITDTRVADTLGQSTTTSFYRLFERFGNIGGPIVIGLLLSVNNYKAVTITWVGIAVIIFAFLFYLNFKRSKQQNHNQKD